MKRVTQGGDINFNVADVRGLGDNYAFRFYTTDSCKYIVKVDGDAVDGIIRLEWEELKTLGDGVLNYCGENLEPDEEYSDATFNRTFGGTTQWYIVTSCGGSGTSEEITELSDRLDAEIERSTNTDEIHSDQIREAIEGLGLVERDVSDLQNNTYTKQQVNDLIDAIEIGDINVAVIDNLNSDDPNKALSARQGKVLKEMIANAGTSAILEQRVSLITEILKNATFTTDQSQNFADLDALEEAVESITLNHSSHLFNGLDGTFTLTATTVPSGKTVHWRSSNDAIATVNGGVVTPINYGNCVITATSGDKSATCSVIVSNIMREYHINVGTLTNVELTDGNGNAITNGQTVFEGSTLQLVITPYSSYEISTASVTMNNVEQTLVDEENGAKSVTLTVNGDIAVSATATYVAKDYAADPRVETITGYGVESSTSGTYKANNNYTCKIVPLDFGKFYHMTDYNWQDGGTGTGYNIALVKSDGNGGYTNIINGTDVTRPYNVDRDYLTWVNNGRIYVQTNNSSNQPELNLSEFYFGIPAASEFNDVEQVYLAVNTKFSTNNVSIDFHIREFRTDTYEDINWLSYRYTGQYTHIQFGGGQTPPWIMRFIPLEFEKTYNYSGYNWSELEGTSDYYNMGLIAEINGIMHLPLASEVSNYDRTFFNNGINVVRFTVPENGTFSVPAQTDFPQGTNVVYLAVIMQGLGQTMDMSNFTITEQNT